MGPESKSEYVSSRQYAERIGQSEDPDALLRTYLKAIQEFPDLAAGYQRGVAQRYLDWGYLEKAFTFTTLADQTDNSHRQAAAAARFDVLRQKIVGDLNFAIKELGEVLSQKTRSLSETTQQLEAIKSRLGEYSRSVDRSASSLSESARKVESASGSASRAAESINSSASRINPRRY